MAGDGGRRSSARSGSRRPARCACRRRSMITWADEPGTEERHGRIMAMPAYVGGEFDVAGLKWIPSVPDNPARNGLPRANALVLLTDPGDRPAARGDGRDGGLGDAHGRGHRRRRAPSGRPGRRGGLPARRGRARPHPARGAARGAAAAARGAGVRPRGRALQPVLRQRARAAGGRSTCGRRRRPRTAVRGAAVVVPATMAVEPSFAAGWIDPGATVVLVSSLDAPLDLQAVDRPAGRRRLGARVDPPRPLRPAAGRGRARGRRRVAGGRARRRRRRRATPGARDAAQRIVVTPVGLAMDDVAAAWHVLAGARSRGLGTPLRLRSGPPVWE